MLKGLHPPAHCTKNASTPIGPQTYLGEGILEEEAVGCQLIDVWGPYQLVPVTAQGRTQVIHDDQKDIQRSCMEGRDLSEIACTDNEPPPMVAAPVLSGPRLAPTPWTAQPTKLGGGGARAGRLGVGAQKKPQFWVAELGSEHGLKPG